MLAFPSVGRLPRSVAIITLGSLGLTTAGLVGLLAAYPVLGSGTGHTVDLGPLDPSGPLAGAAWSLAPVAVGVLFVAIAIRARSLSLTGLATLGLVVAVWAVLAELSAVEPGADRTAGTAHGASAGALVLDPLAATLLLVSVVVGGLIVLYAVGYEPAHLAHRGLPAAWSARFLAWLLLFLSAMHLLVLADDLRLLAVGWEVTTLCSFALIGFDRDAEAVTAARRALLYNLGGGAALGGALLASGPGGRLTTVLSAAAAGETAAWLPIALAGCIGAAAVKSALAPFHPWLLGAMVAAAPVSALLHASTMVKAGSYLVLRLSPAIAESGLLGPALAILGGATFAATALLALRAHDLKRILALSTISSLGLIAAAAGLGSPAALAAGTILLVFHAVAKALAFLAVGTIEQASGTRDVEALVGVVRRWPRVGGTLVVAAAALALPPFGIAVAKWAILELGARETFLVVLLAAGGAASVALWTTVTARLLVRRGEAATQLEYESPGAAQLAVIGVLAAFSIAGLVLAAPVAQLIADPAAIVAFGSNPGLASGWSIVLDGGGFAIPIVAGLATLAAVLAAAAAGRIRRVAPAPYLSGATLGSPGSTVFHGARGQPVTARSGGFYWGEESRAGSAGRIVTAVGWLGVGLVAAAALFAATLGPGAGRWFVR